jgi:chromatin structure-remodeling complex subunit RSC1/2
LRPLPIDPPRASPLTCSTAQAKLGKKTYQAFNEFVHDVTRICHNAQVYNRPSAPIFSDAGRLLELLKEKLAEMVQEGLITADDAKIPDLGPLPEFEDSPPPEDDEEEADEDEDEEEEEDEDDDSDDEGGRRRGRRRRSGARKGGDDSDAKKKHGRPPKVFTPLEARIQAILKGLRRFKSESGQLRIVHFERLPDKAELPDYYAAIRNPIALDTIKKKHKRKKYQSVDQALQDLELMFNNAKQFNEEDSEVYQDAVELSKEAAVLAEQEKAKPDDDFRDEDGRLPLAGIEHRGEIWRVGQ